MTVLQLAQLRAALAPEPIRWQWPDPTPRRVVFNGRVRKVERPVVSR